MKVEERGERGVLTGRIDHKIFELARGMPGGSRWRERELWFPLTRANVEYVRGQLPDVEWVGSRHTIIDQVAQAEDDTRGRMLLPPEASHFRFKTTPRPHQLQVFQISKDAEAFGLFMEQGLGKTKVVLDTAAHLWAEGKIDTLLIVAPNGVHEQWVREQLPLHLPGFVEYDALVYQSNHTKKWQAEANAVMTTSKLRVIAIHVEAFQHDKGALFARKVLDTGRTLWALDESVSIKTPGAKRTKNIQRLKLLAPYRRILTGTPVTRGVEDLYSQLNFLSEDILGFNSYYSFRNRFCVTAPIRGASSPHAVQIVDYQNMDELKQRMGAYTFRATAADCLGLPERTYMRRAVTMTSEQAKLYAEIRDDFLAQLRSGELVTADLAIVRLLRLQQILCGHLGGERIKSNRVDAALAAAAEADGKVVVWARFKEDINILAEAFKTWNPVVYDGRLKQEQRAAEKDRFINDPSCRAFIANQAVGGTGVDGLQRVAHTAIYYSNSFKAVERWQSEARLHRDGQAGTVNIIDLFVPRTLDEHLLKVLAQRQDVANDVLAINENSI